MDAPARAKPEPGRRWSVPLVRVAGVTIRVHVTFLALVGLVALTAADAGETAVAAVGWILRRMTDTAAGRWQLGEGPVDGGSSALRPLRVGVGQSRRSDGIGDADVDVIH